MTKDTAAAPKNGKAEDLARAAKAAELRVKGLTWSAIAKAAGYGHANAAQRSVQRHFTELPAPDREAARALWRARAEALWSEAFADVLARRPGAVRAAAAVAQRAAQLDAFDAPTRVEFYTPSEVEYGSVLRRMVELHRAEQGAVVAIEADPFDDEYLDAELVEPEEGESGAIATRTTEAHPTPDSLKP